MNHHLPYLLTRTLLVVLLALQLGACSSTRLSYHFADRGALWWVEDYVDLTPEQEDTLLSDLRTLRDWHCETQLPRYSEWLDQLRQETARGELSPERIRYYREYVARFLEILTARAVPMASRLLQDLSDEQVNELVTSMREEQAEYREEYLLDDTPEEAVDRVQERAERWLGDLNDRQLAAIRQWLAGREGATAAWLDGRENWQAAFTNLLEHRRQPEFEGSLRDMIINYQEYQGTEHQSRPRENADDVVLLTHQLLVAADSRHWQHLQEETTGLRQDVIALTCTNDTTTAAR